MVLLRQVPKKKTHSPPFCTPRVDNLSLSQPAKDRLTKGPAEYYISAGNVRNLLPGCIVWLPARDRILPDVIVDRRLHPNAFNHPAVILSVPTPLSHNSIVEFAVVSFPQIT
jgi:hypothetical protein